jgi:Protein of unknown function (DUF1761)
MQTNWPVHLLASLVPLIIGFIWYNEKVFGKAWMKAAGMTEEKIKGANMPVIFGLTFLFSLLLSFCYSAFADHWASFQAFFRPVAEHGLGVDATTAFGAELKGLIDGYGERYHTWRHGAVHGIIMSFMFILPVIVINALFERRGARYILMNWGYWAVSIMLMFVVVAQWG